MNSTSLSTDEILNEAGNALRVLVASAHIKDYLTRTDPVALRQGETAVKAVAQHMAEREQILDDMNQEPHSIPNEEVIIPSDLFDEED